MLASLLMETKSQTVTKTVWLFYLSIFVGFMDTETPMAALYSKIPLTSNLRSIPTPQILRLEITR